MTAFAALEKRDKTGGGEVLVVGEGLGEAGTAHDSEGDAVDDVVLFRNRRSGFRRMLIAPPFYAELVNRRTPRRRINRANVVEDYLATFRKVDSVDGPEITFFIDDSDGVHGVMAYGIRAISGIGKLATPLNMLCASGARPGAAFLLKLELQMKSDFLRLHLRQSN